MNGAHNVQLNGILNKRKEDTLKKILEKKILKLALKKFLMNYEQNL